ncbi:MAG TPA: TIGR03000 domain-containing protein [Gemmataceae bacterium]|nr:TIGR03000 domain-containing protein [Gemmataceae bacterium]
MYSVVLMAALSTGGEVPAFGRHGCHGCWGCCGGCWGCHGCCGGCWGCCGGCCGGCWGCCGGCHGCCGGCWGGYGGGGYHHGGGRRADVGTTRYIAKAPQAKPATIVVDLPSDARLFVDDEPTTSTSARRVFESPKLEARNNYSYMLRAELQRDGQTYQQTKKIFVRAGRETMTSFSELGIMQTAQARR